MGPREQGVWDPVSRGGGAVGGRLASDPPSHSPVACLRARAARRVQVQHDWRLDSRGAVSPHPRRRPHWHDALPGLPQRRAGAGVARGAACRHVRPGLRGLLRPGEGGGGGEGEWSGKEPRTPPCPLLFLQYQPGNPGNVTPGTIYNEPGGCAGCDQARGGRCRGSGHCLQQHKQQPHPPRPPPLPCSTSSTTATRLRSSGRCLSPSWGPWVPARPTSQAPSWTTRRASGGSTRMHPTTLGSDPSVQPCSRTPRRPSRSWQSSGCRRQEPTSGRRFRR